MNFRLKIICPFCHMSHFAKADEGLIIVKSKPVKLPEIFITHVTSGGHARIQNHQHSLADLKGTRAHETIERSVLEDMKAQADRLSGLIEGRLLEIPA